MKKFLAASFSVALTCASVSPAFAQTIPTVEPSNGFVRGANPEWQSGHTSTSTPEHRAFHQAEEQAHLQWHSAHNEANTVNFEEVHRVLHQERNMRHRHFHNPPAPEPAMPNDDAEDDDGESDDEDNVDEDANDDSDDETSIGPRIWTGNKPTRRSIIKAAEARERERAAERANQD